MLLLLLAACQPDITPPIDRAPPTVQPGPPVAGMAEGLVDFPMGAPLGGYTGRCNCFGNEGEVDKRQSAYINNFNPSAGVQTRPRAVSLWLENGDQEIVFIKTDAIYAYEGLVEELEERLTSATGRDMNGKVVLSSNHSHNAPANFDHGVTWYLGGDRYNEEIFQRVAGSFEDVALEAYESRVPAAIGLGIAQDWDPQNRVYSDRRENNDALDFFPGIPPGPYKDPNLTMLRIDTADGDPMGMFFGFGIHGTSLGGDNQLWSSDAPGAVELALQERFDVPLIIGHWQHGGGDASPRGSDNGFARLETVGEYASDAIFDLWAATPTSSDPIRLETVTHGIDSSRDAIRVTRGGTVDMAYAPYDPDAIPDEILYNPDGTIATPIDEFNTLYGGAFCGEDIPLIPGVSIGTESYPYNSCVDVETISFVIRNFFDLEEDEVQLPLPESIRATATATRFGPIPILEPDGSTTTDDVLYAFFPGETTAMYTEQFRRRAADELGMAHAIPVGYSQDHEGYLLIPEDWLTGGYEPNINIWGPLQGEHIMEGVLDMTDRWLLTDAIEPDDPDNLYPYTQYADEPLPELAPDDTPTAGTVLTTAPEYLYQPFEALTVAVGPDAEVPRVQGIAQLVWEGGDPGVDLPTVVLERQDDDGDWSEVTTRSGRPITEALPDILLTHTPDPIYPYTDAQTHTWWAAWQAVGNTDDRTSLPEGMYRLHVYGNSYAGGATTWPWPADPYELTSDAFELVPAALSVSATVAETISVSVTLPGPAAGWRLIDINGSSTGANPVDDPTFYVELVDGTEAAVTPVSLDASTSTTTAIIDEYVQTATAIVVVDAWGNEGRVEL